jgi:hypothetical protein
MRLVWQAIAYVVASMFVAWWLWGIVVRPILDECDRGAPPFGSKRWHWPAVGLAAFGMVVRLLLKFLASPS